MTMSDNDNYHGLSWLYKFECFAEISVQSQIDVLPIKGKREQPYQPSDGQVPLDDYQIDVIVV